MDSAVKTDPVALGMQAKPQLVPARESLQRPSDLDHEGQMIQRSRQRTPFEQRPRVGWTS